MGHFTEERKDGDYNLRSGQEFNSLIGELDLLEILLGDRRLTWSNMRLDLVWQSLTECFSPSIVRTNLHSALSSHYIDQLLTTCQ